jgi:transposase
VHFIGIDPHKDPLAACAVDQHGRPLAHASFPNDPAGYADLVAWALAYRPDCIGVEGAGSLGRQATLEWLVSRRYLSEASMAELKASDSTSTGKELQVA